MKTSFFQIQSRLLILSLCLFGLLSSCEKDEQGAPFDGTWAAEGTLIINDLSFEYKDIITFNNGSFNNIGQLKNPSTNKWINFIGMKGSVTDNSGSMTITIKEIGISTVDVMSNMYTGNIVYYKDGQTEFNNLMTQTGMNTTYDSDYSISGNSLTIKTDLNNDGDFNDPNETSVYIKQ
jgi:hypothetical protein